MKTVTYIGLAITIVGLILEYMRIFGSQSIAGIDPLFISLIGPIGLIIFSIGLFFYSIKKKREEIRERKS